MSAALPPAAGGLFAHAVGLSNWHSRHGFCPKCGSPTTIASAGHMRVCTHCASEHFPRHDPAVIMLVIDDDDRCLLGHNPAWPPGRFSTLAGFVEPGETLEQAVRREVGEEVGVTLGQVRYFDSQPWPLPHSLMVGFFADWASGEIRVDGIEIVDANWYRAGRLPEIPPRLSIARRLIEDWLGRVGG